MSKPHWEIDSFSYKNGVLFSFGWIFHPEKEIKNLSLCKEGEDLHTLGCVAAEYGKCREDVEAQYHSIPSSLTSGYMAYGVIGDLSKSDKWLFLCEYTDSSTEKIEIPPKLILSWCKLIADDGKVPKKLILKQFLILIRRGLRLLKAGQFSLLMEKMKRFLRKSPPSHLLKVTEVPDKFTLPKREKVLFFLDHDLGGGANHYRDRLIADKKQEGYTSLVLSFHITTLSYKWTIFAKEGTQVSYIEKLTDIFSIVADLQVEEILYNTAVSFVRPELIPDFLINLKKLTGAKLTVLAHDFFPLCPSHFLLNYEGYYCNIPDENYCNRCLRKNSFGFTSLFEVADIVEWRAKWGELMKAADQVISFSQSTADLYSRVYPQALPKITIIPHKVAYLSNTVSVTQTEQLCIGVVGQIGYHKGSTIVVALAEEIKKLGIPVKIVVIGNIDEPCVRDIMIQTGSYQQEDLPALLTKHGVNVVLFPSIWPETFSYVVQEMIQLGLPIACFDFGAPAERVSQYSKGKILTSMQSGYILSELTALHHAIYLND